MHIHKAPAGLFNHQSSQSSMMNFVQHTRVGFLQRLRLAALAFINAPKFGDVIQIGNSGVTLDLRKNKIVLTQETHIHCTENFTISSDKHLMLDSGRNIEGDREGYMNGVWINTDKDHLGRPIQYVTAYDKSGNVVYVELKVRDGKLWLPDGLSEKPEEAPF